MNSVLTIPTCVDLEKRSSLLRSSLKTFINFSSTFIFPQYFGSDKSSNDDISVHPENSGYLANTRKQRSLACGRQIKQNDYLTFTLKSYELIVRMRGPL